MAPDHKGCARGGVRPTGVERAMPFADAGSTLGKLRPIRPLGGPTAAGAPPRCSAIASMHDGIPSSVAGSATSAPRPGGTERTRTAQRATIHGSASAEEGGSHPSRSLPNSVHDRLPPAGAGRVLKTLEGVDARGNCTPKGSGLPVRGLTGQLTGSRQRLPSAVRIPQVASENTSIGRSKPLTCEARVPRSGGRCPPRGRA